MGAIAVGCAAAVGVAVGTNLCRVGVAASGMAVGRGVEGMAVALGVAGIAVGVAGIAVGCGVDGIAVDVGCGTGVDGAAVGAGSSVASPSPQATIIAVARTARTRSSRILADGEILIDFTSERGFWGLNGAVYLAVDTWVERKA